MIFSFPLLVCRVFYMIVCKYFYIKLVTLDGITIHFNIKQCDDSRCLVLRYVNVSDYERRPLFSPYVIKLALCLRVSKRSRHSSSG
jgi:hypothetical protein